MFKNLSGKAKLIIGWSLFILIILTTILITLGVKGFNSAGINYYIDTVLTKNFLGIPSLLLGVLTFIGYLVMKRGILGASLGAIKTIIGFLLLQIGAASLVQLATPIFRGLRGLSANASVVPLDPYFGLTSVTNFLKDALGPNSFVSWVAYTFIIGFAINIILVIFKKYTNVHSLMVTGHVMLQQASIITAAMYFILYRKLPFIDSQPQVAAQIFTWLISGVLVGFYWGFASNATIKGTQKITGNSGFAVGHQQMLGAALTYKVSRFFGKSENSAENRKLSSKLKIFEDNIFTQTVIVLTLFLVLIIILRTSTSSGFEPGQNVDLLDPNGKPIIDPGTNSAVKLNFGPWQINKGAFWLLNGALGSLKVIASVLAIVTGVRMFVTELQQSFQGISDKIIPGAVVAVDVAAIYGFSANAITYAFFSGTIAQFLAVGILIGINAAGGPVVIVIPLFITLFFNTGALGAFANASGGWKAAIITPAILSFVEILIIGFALNLINSSAGAATNDGLVRNVSPYEQGYIGMIDFNLFFGAFILSSGVNNIAGYIIFAFLLVALVLLGQLTDTTLQTKDTFLQKIFKLKTSLQQKQQNSQ